MFAVLLPVKDFRCSKQRLAGWLSPAEREHLARTMFEDVWAMIRSSFARDSLLVISSEPSVIERCRSEEVPCLAESGPYSHSESVLEATRWAMGRGATSLLSIPIDTPAVTARDLSDLAEMSNRYSVVVVPSADGTGTNALLRTPPDAIAPQFGPGSCALHVQLAMQKEQSCTVQPMKSFAADIDTLDDIEHFLSLNHDCRTTVLLQQWIQKLRDLKTGAPIYR